MIQCPNCHQQIPEISAGKFCPFCGASLLPPSTTLPALPVASPEPESGEFAGEAATENESVTPPAAPSQYEVPWEDRRRLGFLPAFSQTWSDSVFRPGEFFRRVPKTGKLGDALLYGVLIGTAGGLLSLFWEYILWDSFKEFGGLSSFFGEEFNRDLLGFAAVLLPFFTVIAIFLAAFIAHICLMIVGSGRNGFEATLRGLCYSYGPYLFVLVPACGGVIAPIWQYVLTIIAWRELHASTTGRVVLATLLPIVLCCGVISVLVWSAVGLLNRFNY
jgi:hypothetical protein